MGDLGLGGRSPSEVAPGNPTQLTAWESRAARARRLAGLYAPSREILEFYAAVAGWQGSVAERAATLGELPELLPSLLDLVIRTAPDPLAESARQLEPARWRSLLDGYWAGGDGELSSVDFFPRAVLQVYAAGLSPDEPCPRCAGPPQVGALRPMGEGLALDVLCALCLRPRPFPRGRCPACNESSEDRLPVYSAPDFPHLRLQACDACRGYLCLVDLSRDPQAVPEVDEMAGLPLDLWAIGQGYRKLHPNLAGI